MYHVFVATAIGLVLLNRVWQLFKNFGVIAGVEAAERYIQPGVIIYTAPMAFATGSSQSTSNIFKSWCRMFGGQLFLLVMNAWCLQLFTSMVSTFLSNPLSLQEHPCIWFDRRTCCFII